jgi:hypothetical protein
VEKPPLGIFNWLLNLIYLWLAYLDGRGNTADAIVLANPGAGPGPSPWGGAGMAYPSTQIANRLLATDGKGTLVTVGAAGTTAYSTDGGRTWTVVASVVGTADLLAVIWAGGSINLFIAVGRNNAGAAAIATSPDGINWTSRASGAGATDLSDVAFNGTTLVACNITSAANVVTSTNGTTWASHATSGLAAGVTFVITALGTTFFAFSSSGGGGGPVWSSADALAWTSASTTAIGRTLFTAGGALFSCDAAAGKIWRSPTGSTWTLVHSGATFTPKAVAFNGSQYACSGQDGGTTFGLLANSPDGIAWAELPAPVRYADVLAGVDLCSIIPSGVSGRFYWYDNNGGPLVFTSLAQPAV